MSGNWISHVTEMQKNTTALRTVVIYSIFWMQKIATSDRGQRGWIKWRNCGCISAMWLDTWSSGHRPSDNQFWSDLDKAKSSKADSMHSGEFKNLSSWIHSKLDDAWPLFWIILDYLGSYSFEIVTPTYTRLLEAVITWGRRWVSKIFIDCENFSFWFWELAVTTLLSVRSMPTCQGEVGIN